MDEIERCEDALRAAMLAGDVATLERLLGEGATFIDQHGRRMTREDDLAAHRSGLLRVRTLEIVGEGDLRVFGDTAIACVTTDVAGDYGGQAFAGRFAYTRVWRRTDRAWRIEAAHCSAVIA